uniref:Uncharacterized protein n=1 Tax=Pithovirus LCPAC104 TaxID=2506589 RepID=A0A481Z6B4_9VIRU|nr:MAG: hypothetical protein LCPAC104_01270 [Pithovirus LCPAC104]
MKKHDKLWRVKERLWIEQVAKNHSEIREFKVLNNKTRKSSSF